MASPGLPPLAVGELLTGKRVLFTGATGFLGKVSLSMLLHRYGEQLDTVHVLVRKGSAASAKARFFDKVATSEPFEPLRALYGGLTDDFLQKKCKVLDGDITDPWVGLSEEDGKALKGQIDLVINCAGLVSFNPSLEVGLNVNTHGVKFLVDACLYWDVPLVHVSTAFVAGNRSGLVFEDEPVVGYFPRKGELDGRDFSLEQELKDCEAVVARWRQMAEDKALSSDFRTAALKRLKEEGRDFEDEKTLRLAIARERKFWLTTKLTEAGMDRAAHWGWPNTYTYTKSLGEQVIASTPGLRYALVRPSVVESAMAYPFPGWNEGFTTSAPICYAALKGHRFIPAADKAVLDLIPVDYVAGSLIAIAAQQLRTSERRVYHQASGDSNPFYASRSVELVGLYRRRFYRNRTQGNRFLNDLLSRMEPQSVSKQTFMNRSAPLFARGSAWLKSTIDDVKPTWGAPQVSAWLSKAQEKLDGVKAQADTLEMILGMFLPFIWENRFLFRCDNTRSLYEDMPEKDRVRIPWTPEKIDWRLYFLETHMPGLEKWVFPGLDEESEKRRTVSAHRDLLELFDATVHAYRHRVAFRSVEGERQSRFTYGEVHHYAARVGSFLLKQGVKPQARVLLVSENRPEWPMAYFGILRAGATAVPVDPELSEAEVVNVARRADASVCIVSEETAAAMPGLQQLLAAAGVATQVHSLAQALSGDETKPNGVGPVKRSANGDDVATLIFTSGTTGTPKGVMLTHRNFTSLVAKLAGALDVGQGDGVLSVLPLHHTFEFSAGFLTPFSRGAEITYLDELSGDRIASVLDTGRITGMIGVPALWQLLHRKVTQDLAARPKYVEAAVKGLMSLNAELRERAGVNLGPLLFRPIHQKLGGNLKHLVSGGSALPDDVHKAFHALGFDLAEGYGLTESAPVLTLHLGGHERVPGSVGKALPGIELKIFEPDAGGVGEVIAKGPNVMAGYFQDREATDAVLQNGWLHTGDLGRLDEQGRLFLVGRKKDVIIDANGKNVYPDELEELYGSHPHLKELSVVGLPDDAGGEKVACLAVPDYKDRPRDEVKRELEEHFKSVSADQPFFRRIKVLKLWDGELPRTATLKVKRKLVVEELKRLERLSQSAEREKSKAPAGSDDWLFQVVADVLQRPATDLRGEALLTGELGFDSLMLTELQTALEHAGVAPGALGDLSRLQTLNDLKRAVGQAGRRPSAETKAQVVKPSADSTALELEIPEPLAKVGRSLLGAGQRALYDGVFHVETTGRAFIPQNRNVLVVANHASHLDMGLVKVVMGEQGERLTALAARDYFFDSPVKRAYFENFTNLIPMDRKGSLRESLRLAAEALNQGYHLLIFPEGTRSPDGLLAEFKPTLGFLALTAGVDVLPMHLGGTYEAFPKGAMWPKSRELTVRIGPVLPVEEMRRRTAGLSRSESYRLVTRLAEEAVKALRDGKSYSVAGLGQGAAPASSALRGEA
ncbi:MAG: AMP-binding protein [Myxococcaceae bacterium]|nr:AMP-binding protein [Myxococcaceae bacterium]